MALMEMSSVYSHNTKSKEEVEKMMCAEKEEVELTSARNKLTFQCGLACSYFYHSCKPTCKAT